MALIQEGVRCGLPDCECGAKLQINFKAELLRFREAPSEAGLAAVWQTLEASRRIATGVGHVRDAPAHFWPHAKGQGHLGVKLSNTDRANGAELARRIGLGEFTACQALHRLTEGAMNKSGVRNGPERPTLALKWSSHCADAESRVRPLRAFLAVLACDELNIDLDRAEKRARSLSGSDLTAFSLGTEADDDEPALFATSVDYGRADQAGLAAMIDEDDAMDDALDAMLEAQMEAEGNLFDDFAELQGQGQI